MSFFPNVRQYLLLIFLFFLIVPDFTILEKSGDNAAPSDNTDNNQTGIYAANLYFGLTLEVVQLQIPK